jgi:hypothetical protein
MRVIVPFSATTSLTPRQFVSARAEIQPPEPVALIDLLTLALTHGLMAFVAIGLMSRSELDEEGEEKRVPAWRRARPDTPPPADEG